MFVVINHHSRITREKAIELANMISVALLKNKIFSDHLIEGEEDTESLFGDSVLCNADQNYDVTSPAHDLCEKYVILDWLWHTDRPLDFFRPLRTLPFGFIAENPEDKELYIVIRGTITSDEWRNNLAVKMTSSIPGNKSLGLVHGGFYSIFNSNYYDRLSKKGNFTKLAQFLRLYQKPPSERFASICETIHEKIINADWHIAI